MLYILGLGKLLISLNFNFLSEESGFGTECHIQMIEAGINTGISININVGVGISISEHSHKKLFCHKHS